jgi:hypothetical protein
MQYTKGLSKTVDKIVWKKRMQVCTYLLKKTSMGAFRKCEGFGRGL